MSQRGNILFLILLAVVLFAALSYATTSSMRGGGRDASSESADVSAAAIVQSGALFESMITRLRLTNGCSDTQISFENASVASYVNPNAPTDKRCHVFDPAGGGMTWPMPDPNWIEAHFIGNVLWASKIAIGVYFPSNIMITNLYTNTLTNGAGVEMLYLVPFLKPDVCKSINRQLGLPSDTITANANFMDGDRFKGTYSSCAPSQCNYQPTFSANGVSITPTFSRACVSGREWAVGNPESGKTFNVFVQLLIAR